MLANKNIYYKMFTFKNKIQDVEDISKFLHSEHLQLRSTFWEYNEVSN